MAGGVTVSFRRFVAKARRHDRDLLSRIGRMVVPRPYVFVFPTGYVFAAVTRMGWRKTAVYTVL